MILKKGSQRQDYKMYIVLASLLIFFLFSPVRTMAGTVAEPTVEVSVERGDSLITICEQYLEEPRKWKIIARMNRLGNPHRIYPGQILIIPVALLRGEPVGGTVKYLRGDAEIQEKEGIGWKKLLLNDRIYEGSTVRTGKESAIEIQSDSGDFWNQRAETTLGVRKARKKSGFFFHDLFLKAGKTVMNIQKATGRESRFMIETPAAICAARGTEFRTSVDPDEVTRSEVLEGRIDVEAASRRVTVAEGEGTLVKKGEPPQAPKKLLPPPRISEKQKIYKRMPLELAFQRVEGAVSYRVVIAKDRELREVLSERMIGPDMRFSMAQLEDGTYYLQTQSIDDEGLEGLSAPPEEVVVRVNPYPPYIQSPVDKGEYRETPVSCSWLNVKDAVAYHVQIAEDREFSVIVLDRTDIHDISYRADSLDFRNYYFRVSSIAEDHYEGEWSDTVHFTIIPPPPVPQMGTPDIEGKEIRIRWPDLGAGYTYNLQMSVDETFSSVLADEHVEKSETVLKKPHKSGIYYVRTRSIDSMGYEGKFSDPQSFEIRRGLFPEFLGIAGILGLVFLLM